VRARPGAPAGGALERRASRAAKTQTEKMHNSSACNTAEAAALASQMSSLESAVQRRRQTPSPFRPSALGRQHVRQERGYHDGIRLQIRWTHHKSGRGPAFCYGRADAQRY
jgi:hypothetical protein